MFHCRHSAGPLAGLPENFVLISSSQLTYETILHHVFVTYFPKCVEDSVQAALSKEKKPNEADIEALRSKVATELLAYRSPLDGTLEHLIRAFLILTVKDCSGIMNLCPLVRLPTPPASIIPFVLIEITMLPPEVRRLVFPMWYWVSLNA